MMSVKISMPDGRVLFRLQDSRLCVKLRTDFRPLDEKRWLHALEAKWPVERVHQGGRSGYVLLERGAAGSLADLLDWLLESVVLLEGDEVKSSVRLYL